MREQSYRSALIVGAGSGLSASLARAFAKDGMKRGARRAFGSIKSPSCAGDRAKTFNCDAAKRDDVEKLFAELDDERMTPDVVVYNASFRTRGAVVDL